MLDDAFLGRLAHTFPEFYERVNEHAGHEAERLLTAAHGDPHRALVRARFSGAAHIWWPYVKGSIPMIGRDRAAMEAFTTHVLTIYHVVGYQPANMAAARDQVVGVLRAAVDVERLKDAVGGLRGVDRETAVAAGMGALATASSVIGPLVRSKGLRRLAKAVPIPMRIAAGVVMATALASVPLVAGYTAGLKAEDAARNFGDAKKKA